MNNKQLAFFAFAMIPLSVAVASIAAALEDAFTRRAARSNYEIKEWQHFSDTMDNTK